MDETERPRLDALLDLLADEVVRRLEQRSPPVPTGLDAVPSAPPSVPVTRAEPEEQAASAPEAIPEEQAASAPEAIPEEQAASAPEAIPEEQVASAPEAIPEVEAPPTAEWVTDRALPDDSHSASLMTRLGIGIFVAVLLINIPFNAQGLALARSVPTSASLVIRNGLLVKAETSPQIWVYRDDAFHWITSLTAFERLGYRWQNVHIVEPEFLDQFPKGRPFHVLLKCSSSQIYRLDEEGKHWIVDIPTFQAEGYDWRDVKTVPCLDLRSLPDGDSIPPGRGSPPPPVP
jgi:hypothetical protein